MPNNFGLVLTRRMGEDVVITDAGGHHLFVRIVGFGISGQVKLAFHDPPRHFTINRGEIQQRVDEQREAAAPEPPTGR